MPYVGKGIWEIDSPLKHWWKQYKWVQTFLRAIWESLKMLIS